MKIAGSGSTSQRYESTVPDPYQNFMNFMKSRNVNFWPIRPTQDKIFSNKNYKFILVENLLRKPKNFSVGIFRDYRYAESTFYVRYRYP
jgi:hypothetical protein